MGRNGFAIFKDPDPTRQCLSADLERHILSFLPNDPRDPGTAFQALAGRQVLLNLMDRDASGRHSKSQAIPAGHGGGNGSGASGGGEGAKRRRVD